MERYLSLSRAARIVGVKRGTLQKRIQAGEILTFEGMLSLSDLIKAYPQTKLEDNSMIERSARIKEKAVSKAIDDIAIMPSPQLLSARVNKLNNELRDNKSLAKKYIKIAETLKAKLTEIDSNDDNSIAWAKELSSWLNDAIDSPATTEETKEHLITTDTLLSLMTTHIRILPSGHDFFVDGTSSILEAGLRSGLALDYACSNGNCGQCKARLVSGNVELLTNHDYKISDADKANGHILMCCNAAVTDITLEAIEAGSAEDIPEQTITAKVKKVDLSKEHVALLHIKTPRTQRLRFLAGQYVSLGGNADIPISDQSVSSCPCDDMNLHFQVPQLPGDDFSDYVFNQLKSGDEIKVKGPNGDFVLNEESHHSLTFIAWHTGFAPIRSLVEHAMALDVAETINFIWITDSDEDRYLDNLCRSWKDALDNFTYTTIVADLNDAVIAESTVSEIIKNIPDLDFHDIYVAGNATLLDACKSELEQKKYNSEQLKLDLITHL